MKLPAGLIEELRAHRTSQDSLRLVQGPHYTDLGLVFSQSNGRPLDPHNLLNRDFRRTLRRAGLRRIRFHDLRHTFAALMIAQGAHPRLIQEAMGHSSS